MPSHNIGLVDMRIGFKPTETHNSEIMCDLNERINQCQQISGLIHNIKLKTS